MKPAVDQQQLERALKETEWLMDCNEEMLEKVVELCNINSGTNNLAGVSRVAERLQLEFQCLEGDTTVHQVNPLENVDDNGQRTQEPLGPLLHIVKRPEQRPRIVLCIHMDTVYPAEHAFQICRSLDDGRVNGPGVADAKGGLIVMLYALKALERSPWAGQIGWEVIMNPDEELGSPGSERFLQERARHADFGLLFEPTLPDGSLVSWRKGVGNFAFVVRGKSVHAGREFEKGRNAVVACCQLMDQVHGLNTDPDVTFNVGKISGGAALNVVPDIAVGRINVRVKTKQQMAEVQEKLQRLAELYSKKDGFEVELFGKFTSPPKETNERWVELQKRVEICAAGLKIGILWQGTGGASDGNKFAAVDLPNIDTLGPVGGDIHSENEYLVPESLSQRARLTALVLMSFCGDLDSGQD